MRTGEEFIKSINELPIKKVKKHLKNFLIMDENYWKSMPLKDKKFLEHKEFITTVKELLLIRLKELSHGSGRPKPDDIGAHQDQCT